MRFAHWWRPAAARLAHWRPAAKHGSSAERPWLVVGLGNPGDAYARTRHNAGARLLECLRKRWDFPAFREDTRVHGLVSFRPHVPSPLLLFPQTMMNASGESVAALLKRERIPPDHLLVLHDDKDLLFGDVRTERGRGAAGHRGVASVLAVLRENTCWRIRIGTGVPDRREPTDVFVLKNFTAEEERALTTAIFDTAERAAASLVKLTPES